MKPETKKNSLFVNENYKNDLNLSIELIRWILISIGAWPVSQHSNFFVKILFKIIIISCWGFIGFLTIPCSVFLLVEVKDTYLKIKFSGPLSFCFMGAMKYYCLIMREDLIRRCIQHVENDWRDVRFLEDRQIMIDNAIFGRRLVNICAVFMYGSAIFFYFVLPFSVGKVFSEDGNLTYRPLPFAVARLIIDSRLSPFNEILFSMQCISGFILHSITVSACSLAAVFVMHACGQLEVLVAFLGRLVDGTENVLGDIDDRITIIIEHHVRTLNFVARIEELLREISLVEIAGCTLNMCLLGYYAIMEWDNEQPIRSFTFVTLWISFTFNIFIFCYIGELLSEQCKRVGQMTYMIDWYRMPIRKSLCLILTMKMSNCSTKITAGNIFDLSLSCFGDVMKTSVAYINMLRTVTS